MPIRTHRAERAVKRQHEGLLVEWARSSRGLIGIALGAEALQSLVCIGLAALLLAGHFLRAGGATGADLLLVYWTLKLPALGRTLSALAQQYPGQRNVLLRLLEPLSAPVDEAEVPAGTAPSTPDASHARHSAAMAITIDRGQVIAAGHTILREIDLHIAAGEHVAIVGASGAGKSSLIGLLLGWHRLAAGALQIDGKAVDRASTERLRRETAWVDPAIQLWNTALLDNLTYACDPDQLGELGRVLDAAELRHVLQQLPEGLQTYLGEAGALLSGGEGQRVRLARALMQTPVRLALLDEPFRGMDRMQRGRFLSAAREWWQAATLLCVTHDIEETLGFDRVLVIEDGRIVEDGAPQVLAASPSRYRTLLEAEKQVRAQLWQDPCWRRLHLHDGRLIPSPAPAAVSALAKPTLQLP